jgi:hypothetical protein
MIALTIRIFSVFAIHQDVITFNLFLMLCDNAKYWNYVLFRVFEIYRDKQMKLFTSVRTRNYRWWSSITEKVTVINYCIRTFIWIWHWKNAEDKCFEEFSQRSKVYFRLGLIFYGEWERKERRTTANQRASAVKVKVEVTNIC